MGAAPERRRFAFPRSVRLRKRSEFLAVQDAPAARIRAGSFLLLARAGHGPTRIGLVASKRLGGAVQRNRAKRLLRELFRRHLAELPPALELVAIAQGPLLGRRPAELDRDLNRAIRELARFLARPAAPEGEPAASMARRAPRR